MKRHIYLTGVILLTMGCTETNRKTSNKAASDSGVTAEKLAQSINIVDTHIDLPYWLLENNADVSQLLEIGHFDYPRAKAGGLNTPFMSIYVPANKQDVGEAKAFADSLIDIVESIASGNPDKFAIPHSTADVEDHFKKGLVSFPMGMENGAGIEDDLTNLDYFYKRGIRYITLTHSEANLIGDASFSDNRPWNGLSPLGEEVVKKMNRLGIMVDISHVSDSTFYDVLKIASAPLIASHSSCRHFTPGWERNMSDDLIKALAENGGVIQINILTPFLSEASKNVLDSAIDVAANQVESALGQQGMSLVDKIMAEAQLEPVTVAHVADHIDHVVQLTSMDNVGLGTDFGVVDWLPEDFKDVSQYPNLIAELLKRGYSEEDITKICGGNLMRVWKEVERISENINP